MHISFVEERKQSKIFLKDYSLQILLDTYLSFSFCFPQMAALSNQSFINTALIGILLIQYLRSDLKNVSQMGSFLREEAKEKEMALIRQSENIAKNFIHELLKNHYFYLSSYTKIQSLPGEVAIPPVYEFLKKDDVEIHFKNTIEGVEVYVILDESLESNHRFVKAQETVQGDDYLINSEAIFLSEEHPFTADDLAKFLDLVQYGAAILFYKREKDKKEKERRDAENN